MIEECLTSKHFRMIARWPEGAREDFEERAAIMEYDGGLPREQAEWEAFMIASRNLVKNGG